MDNLLKKLTKKDGEIKLVKYIHTFLIIYISFLNKLMKIEVQKQEILKNMKNCVNKLNQKLVLEIMLF